MSEEKNLVEPVYGHLACLGLEATATELTLAHRNTKPNGSLHLALLRGAATANRSQGIIGDQHSEAVAELMETWVAQVLPTAYVDTAALPPGAEKSRAGSQAERRRMIIDMFGEAPLPLLAAWMTQLARDNARRIDPPTRIR